jgi:predicted molibdopterin-dependent oxidoreductase YjgC
VSELDQVAPHAYVEINPDDAEKLKIKNEEMLKVSSRRGEILIQALISERPSKGVVFIPFHYKEAAANILTNPELDPICKIPELKVCAVRIESAKGEKYEKGVRRIKKTEKSTSV